LLRDNLLEKDLNRRKKTNYNNNTLAFRSNPTKQQFKALTAIKPEATNPGTQNSVALCIQLEMLANSKTTEGTKNISER